MEDFEKKVERTIDEYFELERKKDTGYHLSQSEEEILKELNLYFFRVGEIYRILKDKSKRTELSEIEKHHLAQSEAVLMKRHQPVIEKMSIQDLSKNIFQYKYNDFMTSFDEFQLQLIINAFVEKFNLFFKDDAINIINEYYDLSNKKRNGITLTVDEEKKFMDIGTYLSVLEEVYEIYKRREKENVISEEERQNLAMYEGILTNNYKVRAQQTTTFLLDVYVNDILSSGLISPSQRLNLDVMQQIMVQRESEFAVEPPIRKAGK